MKKQHPVISALTKACAGLVFISESDAELEPFLWNDVKDLDEAKLVELAEADEGSPVETTTLDKFFRTVSKEDKPQFDTLAAVLREQLSDIKVYKVGEAEKQVFIVGKTNDGVWAGVKTVVVET